ncbi:hypothetical protein BCR35DRAFT_225702 [Leucosporidium creatinivorum]|uniref:Uncharacterized protein n=1 Tax=Leucosporidium creatinivorum TaxID=106004 RepID=A0A1Y2D7B3_9BASI|nr:hypothetical protein BCR35DRAFT_225702 [Leucosporidium creatinivorum]
MQLSLALSSLFVVFACLFAEEMGGSARLILRPSLSHTHASLDSGQHFYRGCQAREQRPWLGAQLVLPRSAFAGRGALA